MNGIMRIDTKSNILQALHGIQGVLIVTIGQNASSRHFRKAVERMLNRLQILEVIQVIFFDIQNDSQGGEEIQEGIAILTAFQHDGITVADPVTGMEQREITADHDSGVHLCFHQNMGHHRGGRRFAVGTGNAHCVLISLHDHAPSLGPFKHGNAGCTGCCDLGIIIMHSRSTDHTSRTRHIFRLMSDVHLDALGHQLIRRTGGRHIGAGYFQPHTLQHQSQRTHGDTTDANQMHTLTGHKISFQFFRQPLIHINHILRYTFVCKQPLYYIRFFLHLQLLF